MIADNLVFPLRGWPRKIGIAATARPAPVHWPGGAVSFTFDDFPKSALTTGGGILERSGARGTYYAAMSLAGTNDAVLGPMFDREDIRAAHDAGHEIACHTYTHLDCRGAARTSILAEIGQNAAALSTVIDGFAPTNFAYPYGSLSMGAKAVLGPCFSSCRGIDRGINHGLADLAELKAVPLYAEDFDIVAARALIDQARSVGGWLIFFTHDVGPLPSPYGCTPDQLELTVAYAAGHTTIIPVRHVIHSLPDDRRWHGFLAARCGFVAQKAIKKMSGRRYP